jgi:hypothetical protein
LVQILQAAIAQQCGGDHFGLHQLAAVFNEQDEQVERSLLTPEAPPSHLSS